MVHALRGVAHGSRHGNRGAWFSFLGFIMFLFFIETASGERVEWRGLSRQMAVRMFNATGRCAVAKRWGWEEEREPLLIPLDMGCNSGV